MQPQQESIPLAKGDPFETTNDGKDFPVASAVAQRANPLGVIC